MTAPSAHVANVTVGSTGDTGMHALAANSTVNSAVVSVISVHPAGNSSGQPTPAASNVAVTTTV